jgi:2-methylcitrate dehydratase PrpD
MNVQTLLSKAALLAVSPDAAAPSVAEIVRDVAIVAVSGQDSEAAGVLREYVRIARRSGPCSIWGTGLRADAETAAMVNSAAAQSQDYDDWSPACGAHLSGVMVPATAVFAHETDPARGLVSLAVGLMAVNALAVADFQRLYDQGLQPTHLLGTLGAVVAINHLLDLPQAVCSAALGLAATQLTGLRDHTGTNYKGAQGGIAAAAAVRSVQLARLGLRAGDNAVDTVLRLFGVTDDALAQIATQSLHRLPVIAPKLFPSCGASHAGIEAALLVREQVVAECGQAALTAEDLQLTICSPPAVLSALRFADPVNADQARFSMPYCVATAWSRGSLPVAAFDATALADDQVRRTMARIDHRGDPALNPAPGWSGYQAIVTAEVCGRVLTAQVDEPWGYPRRPIDTTQRWTKFQECAGPRFGPRADPALFTALADRDALAALDRVLNVTEPT